MCFIKNIGVNGLDNSVDTGSFQAVRALSVSV